MALIGGAGAALDAAVVQGFVREYLSRARPEIIDFPHWLGTLIRVLRGIAGGVGGLR